MSAREPLLTMKKNELETADAPKPGRRRELAYQIGMFGLCYLSWVFVHMQREFWAMSKEVIKEDHEELPTTFFGYINTSLFLTYALC